MRWRRVLALTLLLATGAGAGCDALAFVGRNLGDSRQYKVKAKYDGLKNKRVAVLVSAAEYMAYRFPNVEINTTKIVTTKLAEDVPGIEVTDPAQMDRFRKNHPYWTTLPYARLVDQLNVDRLVVIDLTEYRTHKPGNRHLWRGVMAGSVGVVANDDHPQEAGQSNEHRRGNKSATSQRSASSNAKGSPVANSQASSDKEDANPTEPLETDPNDFVFYDTVGVRFPPGGDIGVLDQDNQTIELGMLSLFGRDVSRLFYLHKVSGKELRQRRRESLDEGR